MIVIRKENLGKKLIGWKISCPNCNTSTVRPVVGDGFINAYEVTWQCTKCWTVVDAEPVYQEQIGLS